MSINLELYPKQIKLYRQIEDGKASWIGYGGSRGGGKSGSLRRIMLARRFTHPGTWGLIIRRVFDELKRNHIDELFREYPELRDCYKVGDKELTLPGTNNSKIFFGYAETLDEVRRKMMGGQYMDIFVDQAEQFSEQELREIKQACRWPGAPMGAAKLVLFFNMGGAGIQYLKRIFHTKEYREHERPEDYAFVQAYSWDNVSWMEDSLVRDGFSIHEYYERWTEEQRIAYCISNSDYGRNLNSQDDALRKRDLFGSWDSLEGAYFGEVWDRDKAVISPGQVERLAKPWWNRWMSMDWARGHHVSAHWHTRGRVSPDEALKVLGWPVDRDLDVTITYREKVDQGASELDFARQMVDETPVEERKVLKAFWVSPDMFGKRSSQNTIAEQFDSILVPAGLPQCEMADDDRIGGWGLLYNMLLETKRMGRTGEECLLISANCPMLAESVPVVMRDPKRLEDVKKMPTMADDVMDDERYGLKSMISARKTAPATVRYAEQVGSIPDMTRRHLASLQFKAAEARKNAGRMGWRN